MKKYIFLALVFLGTPAYADETTANVLEATTYTLIAADWLQTRQIAGRDDIEEANPLYGKKPSNSRVNVLFALQLYAVYWYNRNHHYKQRTFFNGVISSTRLYVVNNNLELGLEIKF